jgi:hypothetical protein
VLQCSHSEIVGLNTVVRLDAFSRCFCVRVVGRAVELSRSFVQMLMQNTEQRFKVQEFNFEVQHSRRCNLTELRRTAWERL